MYKVTVVFREGAAEKLKLTFLDYQKAYQYVSDISNRGNVSKVYLEEVK